MARGIDEYYASEAFFEEGETAIRIGSFSMQVGSSGEGSKITVMAK